MRNHFFLGRQRQIFDKLLCLRDGHSAVFVNILAANRNGQHFFFQTLSAAVRAGDFAHILLIFRFHRLASRVLVAAFEIRNNALKGLHDRPFQVRVFHGDFFTFVSVKQQPDGFLRQIAHRHVQREAIPFRKGADHTGGTAVRVADRPADRFDGAIFDRELRLGNNQIRIDLLLHTKSRTGRTGAVGIVEGKSARRHFFDGNAAVRTGIALRKKDRLAVHDIRHHQSAGEFCRHLDGVCQTRTRVVANHDTVHNDLNVVLFVLFQLDFFRKVINIAVHAGTDIARASCVLKNLRMLALSRADNWSKYGKARSLAQREQLVDDLIYALLADFLAALRAVRHTDARPEQTQVIVDLRHRSHRGARVFGGCFLVNRNGGRQSFNIIHIRLFHQPQKLPCICGK